MSRLEDRIKSAHLDDSLMQLENDEVDFLKLIETFWRYRLTLIFTTIFFTMLSVLYALSLPDEYQSSVLVSPVADSGSSSLSKMAGQLGGLASLAGISMDSGSADKSAVAVEVIKSRWFLEEFIREYDLQDELYAVRGWDKRANKLKYDLDLYNPSDSNWAQAKDASGMPTGWQTYEALLSRIQISQNAKTGFINITVQYYSPHLAKDWAEKIVINVNDYLRQNDRKDALDSIRYLEAQIEKTNISEMKSVFYKLIEEKTKTLLLTEIGEEYVLKTISPAMVAEVKSKPKRVIICLFGILIGVFMGSTLAVLKILMTKYRRPPSTH